MTYADEEPYAWWSANFDKQYLISSIWILPRNNWADEHLGGSEIWIEDQNCTVVPDEVEDGIWTEFICEDEFTIGKNITIKK